jgi:hypothetical protein
MVAKTKKPKVVKPKVKKSKPVKKTDKISVTQKQNVNVKININDKTKRQPRTRVIRQAGLTPAQLAGSSTRITSFPIFEDVPFRQPAFNETPLDIRQEIKQEIKQEKEKFINELKEKPKLNRTYNKTGKYAKAKKVDNFTSMENAEKSYDEFTKPTPSSVDYFNRTQRKNDLYSEYPNQSDFEFFNTPNKNSSGERISFTTPKIDSPKKRITRQRLRAEPIEPERATRIPIPRKLKSGATTYKKRNKNNTDTENEKTDFIPNEYFTGISS